MTGGHAIWIIIDDQRYYLQEMKALYVGKLWTFVYGCTVFVYWNTDKLKSKKENWMREFLSEYKTIENCSDCSKILEWNKGNTRVKVVQW